MSCVPISFFLGILAITVSARADILNDNFNAVTPAAYSGVDGESFGSATLGNASGGSILQAVSGSGGVGDSASYHTTNTLALRSSAEADITLPTSFGLYFLYAGSINETAGNAFVAAGWARSDNLTGDNATGTDGGVYFNSGINNRILFGLGKNGIDNQARIVGTGQFNTTSTLVGGVDDTTTATLTSGHWYYMAFSMVYNLDVDTSAFDRHADEFHRCR